MKIKNHYSMFKLSELKGLTCCREAIARIEGECENSTGGMVEWMNGERTHLKIGAKNKIAAIERKISRL
tara:strand:+ start:185 stop:391 length:207 start_codon:yes stop_codon:yes gene_type:complete